MKSKRNTRTFTFGSVICIVMLVVYFITQTAVVASAAVMPAGSIAVVTADTKLNLREEPQGKIIGKLARGKEVTILSEIDRDGYYRIMVNETGLECYAYGEFLEFLYDGNTSQYPIYGIPEQAPIHTEEPDYTYEEDDVSRRLDSLIKLIIDSHYQSFTRFGDTSFMPLFSLFSCDNRLFLATDKPWS